MPGNIRLWGTSGYVELAAPSTAANQVLTLPTDSVQPAMVLITTQTFSAATTVSVNNCFSTTYDNYRILVAVSSSTSNLNIRMRSSGTDNSSSNYYFNGPEMSTSSVTSPSAARSIGLQNYAITGIYGTGPGYASIDIYAPYLAQKTALTSSAITNGDTDLFQRLMSMLMNVTTAYDGFTIYPASNTITGSLSVYGYRK